MTAWMKNLEHRPKRFAVPICILLVTLIGLVDFLTGYETFFFIFYLIVVFFSVRWVSTSFGVWMSALSVTAWVSSNLAAGEHYSSYLVPVWNACIMFACYLVVVALLARLMKFNHELEIRVQLRTETLAKEIRERKRLQKELLAIGERERRRISHELHDGLGQQLTGAALAGQFTSQKLAKKNLPEQAEVLRMVSVIEQAIELTRQLSRNLSPVEWQTGRLAENFRELAANVAAKSKVDCTFELHELGALPDIAVATQFFHIAEEAVANAVHHGRAQHIRISLELTDDEATLTVTDDGSGLAENFSKQSGLGLRLMRHRADLLGATFGIESLPERGTRVTCTVPNPSIVLPTSHVE